MREAEKALERSRRYGHALSCVMLDVDHFKSVNDRFGHPAGDTVLRMVASTCRDHMRAADHLGRLGGEEFALLLPETDAVGALLIAERLRQQFEATLTEVGSTSIRVTASFGVASLETGGTAETMLKAADTALYRAKANGRNQTIVAVLD